MKFRLSAIQVKIECFCIIIARMICCEFSYEPFTCDILLQYSRSFSGTPHLGNRFCNSSKRPWTLTTVTKISFDTSAKSINYHFTFQTNPVDQKYRNGKYLQTVKYQKCALFIHEQTLAYFILFLLHIEFVNVDKIAFSIFGLVEIKSISFLLTKFNFWKMITTILVGSRRIHEWEWDRGSLKF